MISLEPFFINSSIQTLEVAYLGWLLDFIIILTKIYSLLYRAEKRVLLKYVLQIIFLSSANFCLTLWLNLYRMIGLGLYIRRSIHLPAFIACKTVYSPKMKSLLVLVLVTISVATVKWTEALPEDGNLQRGAKTFSHVWNSRLPPTALPKAYLRFFLVDPVQ